MTFSIIACPSCNTLLLSDTAQCHRCHHVLDATRVEHGVDDQALPSDRAVAEDLDVCANCGETFRKGLVRCWNCGCFTRSEIAQEYHRRYAERGAGKQISVSTGSNAKAPADQAQQEPTIPLARVDRESTAAADLEMDDDDFELGEDVFFQEPTAEASETSGYALSQPTVADAPVTPPPVAEPPVAEPPVAEPPVAEPPVAEPPVAEPPVAEPAASAPPPAVPPVKAPPVMQPPPEAADSEAGPDANGPEGPSHSEATGGDALLEIARQEELEATRRSKSGGRKRRPSARSGDGFIVFCPNGHRVEVQERHRGRTGRCPKCKAAFVVPLIDAPEPVAATADKDAAPATAPAGGDTDPGGQKGKFTRWMLDVHVHTVDPAKLKLKPGSLLADFQTMDLAFAADELLAVTLVTKGGLFGSAEKKKAPAREAVFAHLEKEEPVDALPAANQVSYTPEMLQQLRVVQPAAPGEETMFAGVPVFGEGRIAVRLPKREETDPLQFASFFLSEFRAFAEILQALYGIENFGQESGIPLSDQYEELICHYSETPLKALQHLEFYKSDAVFKLQTIGFRCEGCGLVVSEDARKKENIGGKSAKGIAKAKCPKCGKKFGEHPIQSLEAVEAPALT